MIVEVSNETNTKHMPCAHTLSPPEKEVDLKPVIMKHKS